MSVAFDHDGAFFSLTFSEEVDSLHCDLSVFTFTNSLAAPTASLTPAYPGSCSEPTPSQATFHLDDRDYLALLKMENLFTRLNNSYLQWTDGIGYMVNITAGEAHISIFSEDVTPPIVTEFDLDLNQGIITFLFDSIIDPITLSIKQLMFHDTYDISSSTLSYQLTGGTLTIDGGTTLCIISSQADRQEVNRLCTSEKSCYLSTSAGVVQDFNGNPALQTVVQVSACTLFLSSVKVVIMCVRWAGCGELDMRVRH